MDDKTFAAVEEAAAAIRRRISVTPRIGVVLGSGLGGFADAVEHAAVIPYSELPHFPRATAAGHKGRLIAGTIAETPVIVLACRAHGYEGHSAAQATFPMRALGGLGVKIVVVTNAAGGIRPDLKPAQLVLLADHINLTGVNPLAGPNDSRLGPRFLDMSDAYAKRLRRLAQASAARRGIALQEGVYLAVSGPSFETPAEIRAFRGLGADLVGMSTVHEVIVARHMGMEVLGISCVANMAAGIRDSEINHDEVLDTGRRAQPDLTGLLTALLPELDREAADRMRS